VVVIDRDKHTVTYTGLYYYLAHFSKYVRPGATRVQTTASASEGLRAISFQNADGALVVELINSRTDATDVRVNWHGQSLTVPLPAVSITTLEWR
jgi:glucosylceramidase